MGINKSLTDTRTWKLGLRPSNSYSGNTCFEFAVLCHCSERQTSTIPEKDCEKNGEDDNDGEWDVHAVHQPHRGHTPPPEKGYCREASQNTKTSISQPAIQLERHNSRSGGHAFESPMQQELSARTKSGKTLRVRSFYSGDPNVMSEHTAGMIMSVSLVS